MHIPKLVALRVFGGPTATARALGVGKSAVSSWPDVLTDGMTDRVIGASLRIHYPELVPRVLSPAGGLTQPGGSR